jgi:hypothetical protein
LHGKGHSKKRSITQNRIFQNTPKRQNCELFNAPRCLNYGEIWKNLGRCSGFAQFRKQLIAHMGRHKFANVPV